MKWISVVLVAVLLCILPMALLPGLLCAQTAAACDFDGNGVVDFPDFLEFAAAYGSNQGKYDLDRNGIVGFPDFLTFVAFYGQTIAPEGETPAPGKVVATISLAHYITCGLITPDGKFLYVMGCRSNVVSVIEIPSHKVVETFPVGKAFQDTEDLACYIAVTPDGKYVYANYNQTDSISVIETSSHRIIKSIAVGTSPWKISITPDGKYAYVPNIDDESISVINTSSNEVVRTISLPERQQPLEVAITPDGKYGYVIGYNNWIISVIDLSSDQVIKTVDTGLDKQSQGQAMAAATPDSRFIYVAFWETDTTVVIGTTSHGVMIPPAKPEA